MDSFSGPSAPNDITADIKKSIRSSIADAETTLRTLRNLSKPRNDQSALPLVSPADDGGITKSPADRKKAKEDVKKVAKVAGSKAAASRNASSSRPTTRPKNSPKSPSASAKPSKSKFLKQNSKIAASKSSSTLLLQPERRSPSIKGGLAARLASATAAAGSLESSTMINAESLLLVTKSVSQESADGKIKKKKVKLVKKSSGKIKIPRASAGLSMAVPGSTQLSKSVKASGSQPPQLASPSTVGDGSLALKSTSSTRAKATSKSKLLKKRSKKPAKSSKKYASKSKSSPYLNRRASLTEVQKPSPKPQTAGPSKMAAKSVGQDDTTLKKKPNTPGRSPEEEKSLDDQIDDAVIDTIAGILCNDARTTNAPIDYECLAAVMNRVGELTVPDYDYRVTSMDDLTTIQGHFINNVRRLIEREYRDKDGNRVKPWGLTPANNPKDDHEPPAIDSKEPSTSYSKGRSRSSAKTWNKYGSTLEREDSKEPTSSSKGASSSMKYKSGNVFEPPADEEGQTYYFIVPTPAPSKTKTKPRSKTAAPAATKPTKGSTSTSETTLETGKLRHLTPTGIKEFMEKQAKERRLKQKSDEAEKQLEIDRKRQNLENLDDRRIQMLLTPQKTYGPPELAFTISAHQPARKYYGKHLTLKPSRY